MDKLIVFRKTYEYLFWLKAVVERFARVHKYSLGAELQTSALNLLKLIVKANYSEAKAPIVGEALVEYEIQRVFVRLAFEYKLLSSRQFEFASGKLDEIGKLLRGWKKSEINNFVSLRAGKK